MVLQQYEPLMQDIKSIQNEILSLQVQLECNNHNYTNGTMSEHTQKKEDLETRIESLKAVLYKKMDELQRTLSIILEQTIIPEERQGTLKEIEKAGHAKCYEIDDNLVLVVRKGMPSRAEKLLNFSRQIGFFSVNSINTVLAFYYDGEHTFELQKRARGIHFELDFIRPARERQVEKTEKTIHELEAKIQANPQNTPSHTYESLESKRYYLKRYKEELQREGDERLPNTRKEELLRRYSLIANMPSSHIKDYFESVLLLDDQRLACDSQGNNILYDKESGFGLIDILTGLSSTEPGSININNMLDVDNYCTMQGLLGINHLDQIPQEDREETLKMMREALIKICIATVDFEHNGKRMSEGIMNKSLATYRKIGIELTYDDVIHEFEERITRPAVEALPDTSTRILNLYSKYAKKRATNSYQKENELGRGLQIAGDL